MAQKSFTQNPNLVADFHETLNWQQTNIVNKNSCGIFYFIILTTANQFDQDKLARLVQTWPDLVRNYKSFSIIQFQGWS